MTHTQQTDITTKSYVTFPTIPHTWEYSTTHITKKERNVKAKAKKDALLCIILKQSIDNDTKPPNPNLNSSFEGLYRRNKTKGILIAIEKAVIFRLAVTPFKAPLEIIPLELII